MSVDCKQYSTKQTCNTRDPNCQWMGKRGCIRRQGVNNGKRYRYARDGSVVEINDGDANDIIVEPPTQQLSSLNLNGPFVFRYNPENDPQRPVLTQKTLFSGGFGITFIPAFPCTTGQRFINTIGKVFYHENNAADEWELSKKIQRLEKGTSQKYFTYPTFECHINFKCPENGTPLNRLTGPEKDLYNYYKRERSDPPPPTLVQHVMEYSGEQLGHYIKRYYDYSETLPRAEFFKILENLFYGIKRLNDNNLVHCDLKEPNIIVSNKKRLRIIDFGLTMSVSDFYNPDMNTLIMVDYPFVAAPECGAFVRKSDNKPPLSYDEFVKSYDKYSLTMNGASWYKYFIPDQAANRQLYDNMVNSVNSSGLTYLTSVDAALKQDPYTLGLIILRLIDKYRPLLPSSNDNPDTVKLCRELIKGLLCPDPRQRFNIKQAIDILKQILKTPHQDPFRVNQDPPEAVEIFSAFGKKPRVRSLKQVNADIVYLNS